MLPHQDRLNDKLIWDMKQNKPKLVADDLELYGVPRNVTHAILLARGVYKWLAIRRKIIKQKNVWKERITNTIAEIKIARANKDWKRVHQLQGYLKAYEECRAEIRGFCHGPRFDAPDFDKEAQAFLKSLTAN